MIDETLTVLFIVSIVTFIPWTILAVLPRRRYPLRQPPALSLILPAHNEEAYLRSTVQGIFSSEYAGEIEVIIVNDGSTDGTGRISKELEKADKRVKTIKTDHLGKALAVNEGVKRASNEIVIILDADSNLASDALAKMSAPFSDGEIGAVSGIVDVAVNYNPLTWYQEFEYILSSMWRYIFDKLDCTYVLPGFAAFRKKALLDAGGFAADTLSEDCDIGLKMRKVGWRMVMSDAVIYTNVPQSISGVAKQRMRWGRGTVQVLKKHRDMIFNPKYGFIGLYGMPNQIYFFLQGFIILPITIYQIFSPYYTWYVSYGNYLSLEVLKYFLTWVSAYGTINYVHNTLTGVWPMTSSFPWFLASYVIIQTYDLIAIARISKMKIRLLFVLFFFFPYYLFTLLFFIVSIFLELNPFSKVRGHMNIWEKNR